MNYCVIGGKAYDVIVTAIEESFTILYSDNTGRNTGIGAPMTLDPIGTFFSHKVTFRRSKENVEEFDALYNYLTRPRYDGIEVRLAHNQEILHYRAYVSQGERALKRIDEKNQKIYWDEFSVNFVPMEAQVIP